MRNRLKLPQGLLEGLVSSRESRIDEHWIRVDPDWWANALSHHGLPAVPLQVTFDDSGRPGISRATVFGINAQGTAEPDLSLLIHSLAWGGGLKYRQMRKRLSTFSVDIDGAVDALAEAAEASRTDPASAYEVLYPAGRTRVKYLGPAFFTKVLYFAGGGAPSHPCLILDARTSSALKGFGWDGLGTTGWSASTYARYCEQLRGWADQAASSLGRPVAADEIERWLFDR
ncbi:hypothetical protein [Ilumatobacter sp.]|uniref:8-oxoguanine DNA glycosylase OGG fold protein n=1 Tax=Ilumatobacter sp. TaxID=1967498 RepID=UPI003750FB4D